MLTKDVLREKFSKSPKKYYSTKLFEDKGFVRKKCPKCGKYFWSIGKEDCGDSSHTPYSFFKKNPTKVDYVKFWKKFADFFKKHGHTEVQRYPVVCRWRKDLPFTIASIVDFQRLQHGKITFEYPSNPLVVPQICLRFSDMANIGVTGRHLSGFMMAGQHAFNYPKEGYWRDKCIELNYKLLTEVMQIPKEELVYSEDVWAMGDFSAFGPCIETFSKGSELVNSVFMQFGLENGKEKELGMKVVDVGWGFERLLWYYSGAYSIYDAVFPREIEFMKKRASFEIDEPLLKKYSILASGLDVEEVKNTLKEKEKISQKLGLSFKELEKSILPIQAIYSIADHSRTLLFALSDGAIPSNTSGGYNLRVLLRRAFSFINEYSFDFNLFDLMRMHAEDLKGLFPELSENLDYIDEILQIEKKKFDSTLTKATRIASGIVKKGSIDTKALITLYESNGITPELLEKAAKKEKINIKIPSNFYSKLTSKNVYLKENKISPSISSNIAATALDFYTFPDRLECNAKVVESRDNLVVLDKTIFYAEGGGQAADSGFINDEKVVDVQKIGGVVIHYLRHKSPFRKGQRVHLKIDAERRENLKKHHTATHLINAAARKVLGEHIWQAGSEVKSDEAHLDVTYFKQIDEEEKEKMERLVNEWIWKAIPVKIKEYPRGEAEKSFGFIIYQGGGPIRKNIRIVNIENVDAEACGGLHVSNTSDVNFVKIIGTEQIQDGVIRIRYKAGKSALLWAQKQEEILKGAAKAINVGMKELIPTIKRFFNEWKERGKKLERAYDYIAELLSASIIKEAKEKRVRAVEMEIEGDNKLVEKVALGISKEPKFIAVVWNKNKFIAVACNSKSGEDARIIIKRFGKGGGSREFARGRKSK